MGFGQNIKDRMKMQKEMAKLVTDSTFEKTKLKAFFQMHGDRVVCTMGELEDLLEGFKKDGVKRDQEVTIFLDKKSKK